MGLKLNTPPAQSARMATITKKNTKPEIAVRKVLHAAGYRYRIHVKDLPGSPDIVFAARRKVIFVHGCFWHRHDCPAGRKIPSGNLAYWVPKFRRNMERDVTTSMRLRELGWGILTIWECELPDEKSLRERLQHFLGHMSGDEL